MKQYVFIIAIALLGGCTNIFEYSSSPVAFQYEAKTVILNNRIFLAINGIDYSDSWRGVKKVELEKTETDIFIKLLLSREIKGSEFTYLLEIEPNIERVYLGKTLIWQKN